MTSPTNKANNNPLSSFFVKRNQFSTTLPEVCSPSDDNRAFNSTTFNFFSSSNGGLSSAMLDDAASQRRREGLWDSFTVRDWIEWLKWRLTENVKWKRQFGMN